MKKILEVIFGLLALSVIYIPQSSAQIDTDRVISVGQNAIYFKDYVLAIQYFNSAITSAPHRAEPYYYRGIAKNSLDDYLGAEEDADEAIKRNPFLYGAYYLRAISRHTLGKDSLALKDYEVVLRDNPDHKGALHNSALLQIALGDSIGARRTLDHLQRFYPSYAEGYLIDGGFQTEIGDTVGALRLFEKAISINPTLTGAYLSMAGIAYDRKQFSEAEIYMNRAIDQMPDEPGLYVNRGIIRYQQYNIMGSMQDYSTAIELDPHNTLALYNRALLRSQVGEINGAQEDFNKVVAQEPDNHFAIFNRAIISNQVGDYDLAEKDLNLIIQRYPTFLPALVLRADARKGQGKTQGAKEDLYLASKLTYDQGTLSKATSKQAQIELEEEESERVRDEKDSNIKKFRSLVHNSQSHAYDELYTEDKGIRGRIQDREVVVEPEPIFTLSYYMEVDKQLKSNANASFSESLKLPLDKYGILVVQHIPKLTELQSRRHLDKLAQLEGGENTDLDTLYQLAFDQLTLKDHSAALHTFDQIIALYPELPVAYFQRAVSRILEYEAAQAAVKEDSNKGRLGLLGGDPTLTKEHIQKKAIAEESIADLNRVLLMVPDYVPALFNIAYIYASLGQFDQAIDYYNRVITLAPELGTGYFNRGLCYYAIGEKVQGDSDLSKAGALGYYKAYSIIKRMK